MEAVTDFIFLGSNVTADGDCSHEIKKQLLLGRKAITNLDSILKSRDITLLTKVHIAKAMVFPGVSTSWNQDCQEKYNLRYADDTPLMTETEEELKSLLMRVKEESEKAGFLIIRKLRSWYSVPSLHGIQFL